MKIGFDPDADKGIRELVASWHPLTRFMLLFLALSAAFPLLHPIIYFSYYFELYFAEEIYWFSIFNVRFGGLILILFLLVFKNGRAADIILASPAKYPRIGISNIWLRVPLYLAVIIGFGFAAHAFRILAGMTDSPFTFHTSIFDFLIEIFFAPISEEIYSRFLILYITAALLGRIPAVFVSTFFFAISHNLSLPLEVSWAAALGFTNALLVIAYGTLWPAIGIHIINNIVVYFSHPF